MSFTMAAFSTGINYNRAQTVIHRNRKKEIIRETLIKSGGAGCIKVWLILNIHNISNTKEIDFFSEAMYNSMPSLY